MIETVSIIAAIAAAVVVYRAPRKPAPRKPYPFYYSRRTPL